MICNTYIQFFGTLADQTKLAIIKELRKHPQSVSELCNKLDLEQSRVSHNLRKLKKLGFVDVVAQGKKRVYSIDKKTILPLLKLIDKHVEKYYAYYCRCSSKINNKRRAGVAAV